MQLEPGSLGHHGRQWEPGVDLGRWSRAGLRLKGRWGAARGCMCIAGGGPVS